MTIIAAGPVARPAMAPTPPGISHASLVDTDETGLRIDCSHKNLQNCGAVMSTRARAADLVGSIRRKPG